MQAATTERRIPMVQQLIAQTNEQFVEAYNRGDIAAVAALYTDDAVLMPPNSPMMRGRQAIQQFWEEARQMGLRDPTLRTIQLEERGDTAYEVGEYTLQIEMPGGELENDKGKYVVVWKQTADGSRKLAVDIWNTDSPLPA